MIEPISARHRQNSTRHNFSQKRRAKNQNFLLTGENLVDNLISYLNRDATYRSLNNIRVYMRKWFICMWIFWATEIQLFFSMSLLFNSIWHLVFFCLIVSLNKNKKVSCKDFIPFDLLWGEGKTLRLDTRYWISRLHFWAGSIGIF